MKRFQIEITAVVNLPYDPEQYPEGMSPEAALPLELEEAAKDPRELLALSPQVVRVDGQVQEQRTYQTLDDLLEKRRAAHIR